MLSEFLASVGSLLADTVLSTDMHYIGLVNAWAISDSNEVDNKSQLPITSVNLFNEGKITKLTEVLKMPLKYSKSTNILVNEWIIKKRKKK